MLYALLILAFEAACGLVIVAVSRAAAALWHRTDATPLAVRSAIMVAIHLVFVGVIVAGLLGPIVLLEPFEPSGTNRGTVVWGLLFCCYVLVVIPFLWLTRNHPDWIWDEVPHWARGEPLATLRAPWYNNWRGSFLFGATLLGAIPFVAMGYHDQSFVEALWTGVQAGFLGTVGIFPFLVGFTFLFPVRIYPIGMRGFTETGLSVSVPWSKMTEITQSDSYGARGCSVASSGSGPCLWLPKAIVERTAFEHAVIPHLEEDHIVESVILCNFDPAEAAAA